MAKTKNEEIVDEVVAVSSSETLVIPDYEQRVEELNRPAIPEGTYLAVITAVSKHSKRGDEASKSIKWSLLLNLGSFDDGWDSEGRTLDLFPDYYTPYGRDTEEGFKPSNGINITVRVTRALGYTDGSINLDDAVGRTLLVTIKHEQDNRQTPEQAANEGIRWSARVVSVARYTDKNGVIAPRLDGVVEKTEAEAFSAGVEF